MYYLYFGVIAQIILDKCFRIRLLILIDLDLEKNTDLHTSFEKFQGIKNVWNYAAKSSLLTAGHESLDDATNSAWDETWLRNVHFNL